MAARQLWVFLSPLDVQFLLEKISAREPGLVASEGRYLRGEAARPLTTLADSRPFVTLNDLLFVAAGHIATVSGSAVDRTVTERGETMLAIQGVDEQLKNFAATGLLPSEAGVPWARPGGLAVPGQLEALDRSIEKMLS